MEKVYPSQHDPSRLGCHKPVKYQTSNHIINPNSVHLVKNMDIVLTMNPSVASTADLAQNFSKICFAFSIVVPSLGGDVPKKNDGRAGFFRLLRKSPELYTHTQTVRAPLSYFITHSLITHTHTHSPNIAITWNYYCLTSSSTKEGLRGALL
jgi:hypothetical protein